MNTKTGELFNVSENDLEDLLNQNDDLIRIDREDMTIKQRKTMKVSLKDNRSKLGKQRLSAVEERKKVFGK